MKSEIMTRPPLSSVEDAITQALREAGYPLGPTDLATRLRAITTVGYISKLLPQMVEAGLIQRVNRGRYLLPGVDKTSPKSPADRLVAATTDNVGTASNHSSPTTMELPPDEARRAVRPSLASPALVDRQQVGDRIIETYHLKVFQGEMVGTKAGRMRIGIFVEVEYQADE